MSEDDLAIETLVELMNGIESGIAAARQKIKERKGLSEKDAEKRPAYDPEKINWVQATGTRGPFQRATKQGSSQPSDFAALVDDLKAHNGKLQNQGFFYWLFDEPPTTVGRKPTGR